MAEQRTDTELLALFREPATRKGFHGDHKKISGKTVLAYPPNAGGP